MEHSDMPLAADACVLPLAAKALGSQTLNTLNIRLDAHMTDHGLSAVRLALLIEVLEASCTKFMLVEERKASSQVHWQGVLWTPYNAQFYRDTLREGLAEGGKNLPKNMYSCTIAPKPDGFERYLCKGPTGKHKETPNVVACRGECYSPGYFVQCHEEWHAHNKARTGKPPKVSFQEQCYNDLVARQGKGETITPQVVRSQVWSSAQAGFKTYMPAMINRLVVLIWCRFDEQADLDAQHRIDVAVAEDLISVVLVGGFRPPTVTNAHPVQEESHEECPCVTCAEVSSNDPLDHGTPTLCTQDEYEEEEAHQAVWRDHGRRFLHQEGGVNWACAQANPWGSVEDSECQQVH